MRVESLMLMLLLLYPPMPIQVAEYKLEKDDATVGTVHEALTPVTVG